MATNNAVNEPTAASGKVLQGQGVGTASNFSTATYPSTATGTGTILRADGTNWVATTATYPNTTTVSQLLYSSSTNTVGGLATANNGALITDGSGIPSIGTVPIAAGGTNATSMATSTGIVKYDGTRLATSSAAKIDSSNRMTNSSQPCVLAYVNTTTGGVTGDGTVYTIVFNSTVYDQASNFNTGTSTFTAPVTGKYKFDLNLTNGSLTASHTSMTLQLITTARTYDAARKNVGGIRDSGNNTTSNLVCIADMSSGDTATVQLAVLNGTKVVTVVGGAASALFSYISIDLLC